MAMQNPFRQSRPHEGSGPDHRPGEQGWEAREGRWDERSSWSEGDGGRTAEAWGRPASGHQGRDMAGAQSRRHPDHQQNQYAGGQSAGWSRDHGSGVEASGPYGGGGSHASDASRDDWGAPRYNQPQGRGDAGYWSAPPAAEHSHRGGGRNAGGYSQGGAFGGSAMGGRAGAAGMGGSSTYPSHGYAPGAQIWEGSGSGMGGQSHEHHEFEPDYLHWREQQLSAFDNDYRAWRDERRQKFSSEFDSWRQSRPRSEAGGDRPAPAANPIVGDVSDGGVGSGAEAKKSQ